MSPVSRTEYGNSFEILLGSLTALAPLSIDMYLSSLPAIARDFHVPTAHAQYSLSAFFAGFAMGNLLSGPLLDRFGRRNPLFVSLALFVLASLGCAFAPSIEILIAARFLQALGGATSVVVPRAVIRDIRRGPEIARSMSRLMLVMGIAPIVAPLFGGWLEHALSWRAIFVVLAVFGTLIGAIAYVFLPNTQEGPPQEIRRSWGQVEALMRDRSFVANALTSGWISAGMFAYIAGSPFVLIILYGVAPENYGWFFGSNAFGLIALSQLNRHLLTKISPSRMLDWAMAWAVVSAVLILICIFFGQGALWAMAAALFLFVSVIGIVSPNATALALEGHSDRAGLASAVLGATGFALAALASSLVASMHDGTARPMGVVLTSCVFFAWSTRRLSRQKAQPSS